MVECAVTLPVLLLVLLGMLDLGIAATRYNALAEASRAVARSTIIRGSTAPAGVEAWGPESYEGTVADDAEIVAPARRALLTMEESQVNIHVNWLDGGNMPRDRVQVEVTYRHEPLIPALFLWGPIDLRSVTTMRVVN